MFELVGLLEVIGLVVIVVALPLIFLFYSSLREKKDIEAAELVSISAKERLKIVERKFMQGRISKTIFDSIVDDLEEELYSAELVLFRARKSAEVDIEDKASLILQRMKSVSKRKRKQVEGILKETSLIRHEIDLLEAKLLKREIKQSVFDRLIKKKETELIKRERELTEIVLSSKADLTSEENETGKSAEKETK